jgi:hypothetical protein
MTLRLRSRFTLGLLFALVSCGSTFAQGDRARNMAAAGGFMLFVWLVVLAVYLYMSLAIKTIAEKTNTENAWLAWIPIANLILLLNIAKKPVWWIILLLIPLVNIVIAILVWIAVAEARQKPGWLGALMIVPLLNFFVPGYLAWSD